MLDLTKMAFLAVSSLQGPRYFRARVKITLQKCFHWKGRSFRSQKGMEKDFRKHLILDLKRDMKNFLRK